MEAFIDGLKLKINKKLNFCLHIYIYIYIYIHIYLYIHYIFIYPYIHIYEYVYIQMYQIYTNMMFKNTYTCMYTRTYYLHIYWYICINIFLYISIYVYICILEHIIKFTSSFTFAVNNFQWILILVKFLQKLFYTLSLANLCSHVSISNLPT